MLAMYFKSLLLILLLSAGVHPCRAKLGETEAQCVARYGPEFDVQEHLGFDVVGEKAASFKLKTPKGAFLISVTFLNGMDAFERVTNADSSRDISDDQKQALLNSESAGFRWTKGATHYRSDGGDNSSGTEAWQRSDGAKAVCWVSGKPRVSHGWGEIDFSTREYSAAQGEMDRQDGAR